MNPQITDPLQQASPSTVPPIPTSTTNGEQFFLSPEDLPNLDDLIIEDGKPVENIFAEKQLRLLTEPLYASWPGPGEGRPFLVLANVGLFYEPKNPALVPDVMLSLDVSPAADLALKDNRSYFTWLRGKTPDVVIEIVSDKRGDEDSLKVLDYARIGIPYYVIFDPKQHLKSEILRAFIRKGLTYEPTPPNWLPEVGLGLTLWEGVYEGQPAQWLRWCDREGMPIPTGRERSEGEHQRAEQERQRAEQERQRAEQERQRAEQERQQRERLEALLRAHGIDPSV